MSHTSRNFVVAYVLLVGLPLLGLAGVLRSGRRLVAPISVDGIWKIEGDTTRLTGRSCAKFLSSLSNTSVVISQSGKGLVLTFYNASKTVASGMIDGKGIEASVALRDSSSDIACSDQALLLKATVDPKSEPRGLSGVLSVSGCASCAPVEFKAVRQPRVVGGGTQ